VSSIFIQVWDYSIFTQTPPVLKVSTGQGVEFNSIYLGWVSCSNVEEFWYGTSRWTISGFKFPHNMNSSPRVREVEPLTPNCMLHETQLRAVGCERWDPTRRSGADPVTLSWMNVCILLAVILKFSSCDHDGTRRFECDAHIVSWTFTCLHYQILKMEI
jgi:hypothetical protein